MGDAESGVISVRDKLTGIAVVLATAAAIILMHYGLFAV